VTQTVLVAFHEDVLDFHGVLSFSSSLVAQQGDVCVPCERRQLHRSSLCFYILIEKKKNENFQQQTKDAVLSTVVVAVINQEKELQKLEESRSGECVEMADGCD